jgi:predicted DsbA family dithiol-disulfide isomerase
MLIEIFADLICPWCYIGKHRFDAAIAERPGLALEQRWQPFELNPDMPPQGMGRDAYLAAKFGGLDRARQIYGLIEEAAARDGIALNGTAIDRTPNTLRAHRLVRLADRAGLEGAMVDALFHAYFVDALDIGDLDILAAIAAGLGLDGDLVRLHLESGADLAGVRGAEVIARRFGIQAVPCFVFDRKFALAGAQESPTFLPLLDLALAKVPAASVVRR